MMEHLLTVQYLAAFLQNVLHRIQRLLKMNNYLYTSDNVSSATCFICMDCKGPFVELIKKRKAYEGQQEMVRGLLEGKLNEEKSKARQARYIKLKQRKSLKGSWKPPKKKRTSSWDLATRNLPSLFRKRHSLMAWLPVTKN